MASDFETNRREATQSPARDVLIDHLVAGLQVIPLRVTLGASEVAVEELVQIILDHLGDGGYAISRKPRLPEHQPNPPRRQ